ncbi:MarR family winged helix-turn-helix transcriptional regulator [Crenalkalicoccus roseus]|uniref:MarR family winged helix-turn-helix transcriptional regulator n=1 Tax=Crenalkalicoccus roseus TaxID=1485588 RepID=UPI0010819FDC|nr:MarR family transcriptional regulator [Crenalkalicoccus roseus]
MEEPQPLAQLQWRLGRTIGQISRRWRARLDARMAAFGLTEARWLPLLHLARAGEGLTQRELAARLGVEGPTLVRTLDWLEREGFVQRRAVPHDRRLRTLHLTSRARALHRRIEEAAAAVRAEILGGIPEAELAACLSVLEGVAARLGAPPEEAEEEQAHGHRAA